MKAREITGDTISDKEICSKIITAGPNMYMPVMRNFHKDKGYNLEIEDLEEEMCELYSILNINEEATKKAT